MLQLYCIKRGGNMKTKKKNLIIGGALAVAMGLGLATGLTAINQAPAAWADPALPTLPNYENNQEGGAIYWTHFDGADGYYWTFSNDNGFTYWDYIEDEGPGDYELHWLDEAKSLHLESGTYNWSVKAVLWDDDSEVVAETLSETEAGSYAYVSTQTPIAAPDASTFSWDGASGCTIRWAKDNNATGGYTVYYYEAEGDVLIKTASAGKNDVSRADGSVFQVNKEYYFRLRSRVANGEDLEHTHSALSEKSANFSYPAVAEITNVAISEDGVLTFDDVEIAGAYYNVYFYDGETYKGAFSQSTPELDLVNYLSGKPWHDNSNSYKLVIKLNKYGAPLAEEFVIDNWKVGDVYPVAAPVDPEPEADPEPEVEPEAEPAKEGLSAGAIAGIVIASVVAATIGGFAIYWFVLKKKKWADFIALFKRK